jgi:hypothetical protein
MPYNVGEKGSYGCSGYPVVKEDGKVMGCHKTKEEASSQQKALYANEKSIDKSMDSDTDPITGEEREAVLDPAESPISWGGVFKPVITKAAKPNYGGVIKPRKGEPADKELYNRVISEAKRKFDVYPSAYANAWVVQEYKRRGGKYKSGK